MNDTTMTVEEVWQAVDAERSSLVALLADLAEADWDHRSLCADWRIRDVVAHMILTTDAGLGSVLVSFVRARGNLDRTIRDSAIRLAQRLTTTDLLTALRATIGSRATLLRTTPEDRLMDVLVHGQDIAIPLGVSHEMPARAARSAIERVWEAGTQFHLDRLSGYRLVATDIEWAFGDGPIIEATMGALLLLATGRSAAYEMLTGSGVARLTAGRLE